MLNLEELFEKYEGEFLKFTRIEPAPDVKSPDLVAFSLLYSIVPPKNGDMVANAEHDEIWLGVNTEKFAALATEEQVLTLIRCGLRYDAENESFAMFV